MEKNTEKAKKYDFENYPPKQLFLNFEFCRKQFDSDDSTILSIQRNSQSYSFERKNQKKIMKNCLK